MDRNALIESAEAHYSENEVLELDHAISVATEAHEGQKRVSGDDYISHPLEVAGILIDWGMDMDTVVAGILHDTLEDTEFTLEQIETLFW